MRFTAAIPLAALLYTLPAMSVAVEPMNHLEARAKGEVHCVSKSASLKGVLSAFDKWAGHLPWETCGGISAPTFHADPKKEFSASGDGKTKFYVCNKSDHKRCITLGADKRTQLQNASKKCGGKAFWIKDQDGWSYGVDPVGTKECGA